MQALGGEHLRSVSPRLVRMSSDCNTLEAGTAHLVSGGGDCPLRVGTGCQRSGLGSGTIVKLCRDFGNKCPYALIV